jgi:hypothetical protein
MGVTVGVNGMSVVHEGSSGIATAFPDACNTPGPPVPVPYPNVAQSSDTADGTKKVKCDGKSVALSSSNFSTSSGDEAGSAPGGVVSAKTKGKAEFVNFSFDVKFEGKNVERAMDMVTQNSMNTPPFPVMQGPAIAMANVDGAKRKCCRCEEALD